MKLAEGSQVVAVCRAEKEEEEPEPLPETEIPEEETETDRPDDLSMEAGKPEGNPEDGQEGTPTDL